MLHRYFAWARCAFTTLFLLLSGSACAAPAVGVFYYPGWAPELEYAHYPDPWKPIRRLPGRLPAKGEYDDGKDSTWRKQLNEMKRGGISFVVFDTYIAQQGRIRNGQAVAAYKRVAKANDPQFCLMWANHDDFIKSLDDFDKMADNWRRAYISDSRYLNVGGRPVLFLFSVERFEALAAQLGVSVKDLITRLNDRLGLPMDRRLFLVAGANPNSSKLAGEYEAEGFSAVSYYNLFVPKADASSLKGFPLRDSAYRGYWKSYLQKSSLPVVLPLTAGWDRSPWGATAGSRDEGSRSTPGEFGKHVSAGLSLLQASPNLPHMAVICCWNEYGEGSVIEPTREFKDGHLKELRQALSRAEADGSANVLLERSR